MSGWIVSVLLAVLVAATWLGCLGFVRLRGAPDRLHCVAFVNVAGGVSLILAALAADGASVRVAKIALMVAVSLLAGAATSHATGRMLLLRRADPERGADEVPV